MPLLLLFALLGSCVSTKPTAGDCAGCKTGHFTYDMYDNSGIGHWPKMTLFVERNDSLEIITRNYPIQDTVISRITWLSDCKYNLQRLFPVSHFDSLYVKLRPKGNTYTIKKVTANYILTKQDRKADTLWRVN